jgi:hypothetical protein
MRIAIAVLAALAWLTGAQAQGDCMKPDTPACATARGPFATGLDYDACRKEMLAYKAAMETHAQCLDDAQRAAEGSSAREELAATLARFNRRARGEAD